MSGKPTGALGAQPLDDAARSTNLSQIRLGDMGLAGPNFYGVGSFAAPVAADLVMSSALQIAAQMQAKTWGPDDIRGGKLISIFPSGEEPAFVSISARPLPGSLAWVRVGSQGLLDVDLSSVTNRIAADLKSDVGVVNSGVLPPEREVEHDPEETLRLEREIQELLETMAADPAALETISAHIYLRELKLQYMTDLGC